ncbi:hypothetical protein Leryth_021498 [Lithospermum erythrorhizon]|nr:hypothetical protein Leryth_021498 [Lithospermum erythrorhizon]
MAGETQNTMNLDLNLGPVDQQNDDTRPLADPLVERISLEEWLNVPNLNTREVRQRHQRWRYDAWQNVEVSSEARNFSMGVIGDGGVLQAGEGSVATEGRSNEGTKVCENNNGYLENDALGKKDVIEKGNGDEMSFFDCNICLDLAKDPVVTCCGHLFCWPCLYRWLHKHSHAKECPVCKGEVTVKNVTPIYGRGSSIGEGEDDSGVKVPNRPQARRVESWRQAIQRSAFAIPMEEMIRRLGTRFELSRDLNQTPQNAEDHNGSPVSSLLSRILTSRGLRREQQSTVQPENVIDLTESGSPTNLETGESRLASLLQRRSNSYQAASMSNLTSGFMSAERLVESYFQPNPVETNQERPQIVDDRDSMSSIAAVIHSESQTVDTAVEIQSNVSLSTSSSRRRNEPSRTSDFDSGESRAPRRRRLH